MTKFFTILLLVGCVFSCHDSREVSSSRVPTKFKRSTGEQIPLTVALDWVQRYRHKFNTGREVNSYTVSADVLSSLLGAHDNKVGVAFHHGISQQQHHILVTPVINGLGLWDTSYSIDANNNGLISTEMTRAWANAYSADHQNEILFHFFGIDVFSEIRSNPAFNYIIIQEGLNENGQQLLLFVYNNKSVSGGRMEGDEVTVYDASSPCPPCDQN